MGNKRKKENIVKNQIVNKENEKNDVDSEEVNIFLNHESLSLIEYFQEDLLNIVNGEEDSSDSDREIESDDESNDVFIEKSDTDSEEHSGGSEDDTEDDESDVEDEQTEEFGSSDDDIVEESTSEGIINENKSIELKKNFKSENKQLELPPSHSLAKAGELHISEIVEIVFIGLFQKC